MGGVEMASFFADSTLYGLAQCQPAGTVREEAGQTAAGQGRLADN